jgi:hypothetical protein
VLDLHPVSVLDPGDVVSVGMVMRMNLAADGVITWSAFVLFLGFGAAFASLRVGEVGTLSTTRGFFEPKRAVHVVVFWGKEISRYVRDRHQCRPFPISGTFGKCLGQAASHFRINSGGVGVFRASRDIWIISSALAFGESTDTSYLSTKEQVI